MTTLVHPNAQPVVYAHQITSPQAVGSVTSTNWKRAFDALVASVDRDLMRGEPTAVEMARELIGFEILNPGIVEKEAAIEAEIAAKPKPKPAPKEKKPFASTPDVPCDWCSRIYTRTRRTQRFCSLECRDKSHNAATGAKRMRELRERKKQEALPL